MSNTKTVSVFFLIVILLVACNNNKEDRSGPARPGREEMADLNRYFVQKDKERIQNYIERKNLIMKESPTGLWYGILREGTGSSFTEGSKVVFDYDCSLLDGTECYSSAETGPKEVILGRSELEEGLNQGLRMLKPGAEAIFIIPPFLAYGLLGDRKKIPPRAVLVYKVYNLRKK